MTDNHDDNGVGDRIRQVRESLPGKVSQLRFANMLGNVSRGAVGNWELGKGIKRENLISIADRFDVSLQWLATGSGKMMQDQPLTNEIKKSAKLGSVPIKGIVEAGNWQDIERWGADEMADYVPSSSDYPIEWQYAFIVRGESLNKVARPGDRLICLDTIASGVAVLDGDLVIVERSRYGGQIIERTAKRVRRTMRGFELWPESDSPDHQDPIEWRPGHGDHEEQSVRVVAKVIWILRKP